MGLARGLGIKAYLPPQSRLLHPPWVYGLEDKPGSEGPINEKLLTERFREVSERLGKAEAESHMLRGARMQLEYFARVHHQYLRDMGIQPETPLVDPKQTPPSARPTDQERDAAIKASPNGQRNG
jgi:hypothetical protein